MKRSSKYLALDKDTELSSGFVFPDSATFTIKTLPVSLEEIIYLSEQMLPFENRRRQKSGASFYTPFTLR